MKVIKENWCNMTFAENQPQYLPLPAFRNVYGDVVTSWQLSFWERLTVLFTGKIYLKMLTFNKPLQPVKLTCDLTGLIESGYVDPNLHG